MGLQNFQNLYNEVTETYINHDKKHTYYFSIKHVADKLLAVIALIILFPIVFLVAVAIKVESKGPIFYFQERVGLDGKIFKVIKLRSMRNDAEINGAQWAQTNDPRVTRVGDFIRKTRIDEIPQFINILKGEMSLIGPRPERPMFTDIFNKEIPGFRNRLLVKPGLTGWAQVNGGYEISPKEKLIFDMYYINNIGIILELVIIFKTIKVVFTGNGAR
jgi:exopolysaccharide biosynthesis polyprenyl glycosylphosphotransferase